MAIVNSQTQLVYTTGIKKDKSKEFTYIMYNAKFLGIYHSYVAKLI
jgi:hypothetical protein